VFGDSLTQRSFEPAGWGAALAHLYGRRCDVYNRGYGRGLHISACTPSRATRSSSNPRRHSM